uniref:ribosomal protein S18 n=1 Tax=Balanophora yakushimensis TaxID=1128105 RepID=UPI0020008592|nr:ribosomal protein S18 [Balanophora yakushimensis]UNQ87785.1 ribosomal protein S18 [Balanophora yakushimensis]
MFYLINKKNINYNIIKKYINKKKYILSKKKNKIKSLNQKLINIFIKQYRILSLI